MFRAPRAGRPQRGVEHPPSIPGLLELKKLLGWSGQTIWLLGKGLTATWRDDFLTETDSIITLNHACEFINCGLAHFADLDALDDCTVWLRQSKALKIVIPESIHINNVSRGLKVAEITKEINFLSDLHSEGRLFTYPTSTGDWWWKVQPPIVQPKFFSAEAAYQIAIILGASKVKTLGIGDGDDYSPDISLRGKGRKMINGRSSFDSQGHRLRQLEIQMGVPITRGAQVFPIFIGASHRDSIPSLVLRHSLIRTTSAPIQVSVLPNIQRRNTFRIPRGTPFSLSRFQIPELMNYQGRALYLDSDMLVFGDIAELFATSLGRHSVGLVKVDSTPAAFARNKRFKAGRQTSVMLIDCARARWNLRSILNGLHKKSLTYEQVMHELAFMHENEIYDGIHPSWNSLNHFEPESTKLIHFTDIPTQPWRQPYTPLGEVWLEGFRRAVRDGAVPWAALKRAVRKGDVHSGLLREFQLVSMPFDADSPLNSDIAHILKSFRSSRLLTPYFRGQSLVRSFVWRFSGLFRSLSGPDATRIASSIEKEDV